MTQYRGMEVSDFWPHQFVPNGKEIQIGEEPLLGGGSSDHGKTMRPIMAQAMYCIHCHLEYVRGKDTQPTGKCPARETKREIKRITES